MARTRCYHIPASLVVHNALRILGFSRRCNATNAGATGSAAARMVLIGWWLLLMSAGCATLPQETDQHLQLQGSDHDLQIGEIVDTSSGAVITFPDLLNELALQQVVYVGETHSSAADHEVQRRILEGLYGRNRDLAVAMEMFPRSVQPWLDRWSRGELGEVEFLQGVDWEHNWGFPVGLYRPLLDYCAANRIPILGLNAPSPIVRAIAQRGLGGLESDQRAQVAKVFDFSDEKHRTAIRAQYDRHMAMHGGVGSFERFYEAQLAWEETMAETVADQFISCSRRKPPQIVVFAGNGHVEYRYGIPARAFRRFPHAFKTVVPVPWNSAERTLDPALADYFWITDPSEMSHGHRGRLGVRVESLAAGKGVRIAAVMPGGPAAQAGIKPGDILVRIDDTPISGLEDVHQALAFQQPRIRASHRVLLQRDGTDVQLSIVIPKEP